MRLQSLLDLYAIIQDQKGVVLEVQEEKSNSEGLKDITPVQAKDSEEQKEV